MVTNVVTRWSYGNALQYGLSIFVEFEKIQHPSIIPIWVRLNMLPHIIELYKHG